MLYRLALTAVAVLVVAVLVWSLATDPGSAAPDTRATVGFDTTDWELRESSETRMLWKSPEGDTLCLERVPEPAGLPVHDVKLWRAICRDLARTNDGGLVSADILDLGEIAAGTLIYKCERRPAYAYTGMMILPGAGEHFVIAISSVEHGVTGVRDALVTVQLLKQGILDLAKAVDSGKLEDWFYDPYDSAFDANALNSVADDERYDSLFPSHPLSKIRRILRTIAGSLHWGEGPAMEAKPANKRRS